MISQSQTAKNERQIDLSVIDERLITAPLIALILNKKKLDKFDAGGSPPRGFVKKKTPRRGKDISPRGFS